MAVLPPTDESTCASSVVGTWSNATPRWYTAAAKPARSPTTPPPSATTRPSRPRIDALASGVHREVGDRAVQRVALGVERAQLAERIAAREQRPVAVVAHPFVQVLGPGTQVDHGAVLGEPPAAFLRQHHPAASAEHHALQRRQFGEHLRLACAKPGFALDLEDQRDLDAATAFDLLIGVEKAQGEAPREQPPDGGLAGAHHADEIDVVPRALHARHCRNKNGREVPAVAPPVAAAAGDAAISEP